MSGSAGEVVYAARAISGLYTAEFVDADTDSPVPWLATAYLDRPSLSEAVTSYGPLPVASVRALAAGLAEALSAVHAMGLVHRDLKPSTGTDENAPPACASCRSPTQDGQEPRAS